MGRKLVALLCTMVVGSLLPPPAAAEQGLIAGVDAGVAVPTGGLKDREHVGGMISPFAGYMFSDILGLVGSLQLAGFPAKDRPGTEDNPMFPLGATAGPRVGIPLDLGGVRIEPNGTFQAGVFTGLTGHTPVSRTSWGYTAGGGVNFRLTDQFLLGAFGRFNSLDQRAEPGKDVEYVTTGLSFTYNEAPPPAVAQVAPPPLPAPAKPPQRKLVLRGVHFDFNKATIRPDARPVLNEAVDTLKKEGGIAVVAEGYTDSIGGDAYNMQLSLRRARAVKDYLVAGGIAPSRISVEGFGKTHPVASNATADGRAQNRRVELRIRGN
jgi:outer membrane protein OmpA-like peptidoglycan-associated protein